MKNYVISSLIETCDHCGNKVVVLWQDKDNWLICPKCWPLYKSPTAAEQKEIDLYLNHLTRQFCKPDCVYLSPTELEQDRQPFKGKHRCNKYKKCVYHGNHHPSIIRLKECSEP